MARIGYTTCKTCGNPEASVSETATGTLSVSCHRCELSSYAKKGSKAARLIRADLRPDDDAPAPAGIADAAAPPPAPAEKSGFNLGLK